MPQVVQSEFSGTDQFSPCRPVTRPKLATWFGRHWPRLRALSQRPKVPAQLHLRAEPPGARLDEFLFGRRSGKSQVTTKASSMLYGCLDIAATEIPIKHQDRWRVDSRPVVIPSTKGRILAHRPMFDDWSLEFAVQLDETMLGAKFLRNIIDDAGKRIGLGDFRPACKGPFGRFVVTQWEIV